MWFCCVYLIAMYKLFLITEKGTVPHFPKSISSPGSPNEILQCSWDAYFFCVILSRWCRCCPEVCDEGATCSKPFPLLPGSRKKNNSTREQETFQDTAVSVLGCFSFFLLPSTQELQSSFPLVQPPLTRGKAFIGWSAVSTEPKYLGSPLVCFNTD